MADFTLSTIHYAHICIISRDSDSYDQALDMIDETTKNIINKLGKPGEQGAVDTVEVDPDFRCHALTEVGLRGSCRDTVTAAAKELVSWVKTRSEMKLIAPGD